MSPRTSLNDAQIGRLKELFEAALSQPSGERGAFVTEVCSGDYALETELSSLLEAHDSSSGFFERLADELVIPVLSAGEVEDTDESKTFDRHVSHYELEERIGRGGMGVVYKARDTRLGRPVALKFIHRHQASNPAARARLLSEAKAASALDHPNIGVVYEIGESEDARQFIAMGWYEGETLSEMIRRGPLAAQEAVSIAAQLGSALGAAHRAGIIHRDVKPANVIVTSSGTAKLLDFGIAKLMSEEDESHPAAGTIAYMSPEQTRNEEIDTRTDIWSLGVVLYEMLTGQRPFKRGKDQEVVAAIRDEDPVLLSLLRPGVPVSLDQIVATCLRKDRTQRFQSAEEFSSALRNWDSPAGTERAGPVHEVSSGAAKGFWGRRTSFAIGFMTLAALAVGSFAFLENSQRGTTSTATPLSPVSVAVLPFADSTLSDSSRYLTVAIPDEIRTELSRFASVTVPSYLSSTSLPINWPPSQVARKMGSRYIMTGALRREATGARVRLTFLDGKTGKDLWHSDYDANSHDRIRVVGETTAKILASLQIGLSATEKKRLETAPTTNDHAYDLYLRARYAELIGAPRRSPYQLPSANVRQAQALYAQARALDPNFARTHARLALSHMYSAMSYDTTAARLDQARIEAELALRIDSSLFEAHSALSQYWSQKGDVPNAIRELEIPLASTPNNVSLLQPLGFWLVGAGRWDDGIAKLERVMQLDPRNSHAAWQAGVVYGRLRRNDKAMLAFDRVVEIDPEDYFTRIIKGHCYLRWTGSVDTLESELNRIPPSWDKRGMATYGWYTVSRVSRNYREGIAHLAKAPTALSWDNQIYHPRSLMRADLYDGLGDTRNARINYDSARAILVDSLAAHPENTSIHAALGLAYAGLGKEREAIQQAEIAMGQAPVARQSMRATAFMGISVEIFARTNEFDRAFQLIELMLSMPAGREMTVAFLQVWPGFDPLRKDPRFDQIVERFTAR